MTKYIPGDECKCWEKNYNPAFGPKERFIRKILTKDEYANVWRDVYKFCPSCGTPSMKVEK